MERADAVELGKRIVADFVARAPGDPLDTYAFRLSSGTSGKGILINVLQADPAAIGTIEGARDVVMALGPRTIRVFRAVLLRRNGTPNQHLLLLDGANIVPQLDELLRQFGPDTLYGLPSFQTRITEQVSSDVREGVETIVTSGEYFGLAAQKYMHEKYPRAAITEVYGSSETGELARTCPYDPTTVYHPLPEAQIEIEQPDEEGVGDILITKTIYRDQEILRYRNGDAGRLLEGPCKCGARTAFTLLGRRGYDFVRIQGLSLVKEEFDRVASSLKEYVSDYRAEAFTLEMNGVLRAGIRLSVYDKNGSLSAADIEKVCSVFTEALMVTPSFTLADAVAKGHCAPLEVVAVPEPFPQSYKDIKLTVRA